MPAAYCNPQGSLYADYQKIGAGSATYGVVVQLDNGNSDASRIAIHTKPGNDSNAVCVVRNNEVTQYSLLNEGNDDCFLDFFIMGMEKACRALREEN